MAETFSMDGYVSKKKGKHDKTWGCHVEMLSSKLNPNFNMLDVLATWLAEILISE